jgi:hypothetical protein
VSTTPTSSTIILEPIPDVDITDSVITATAVDCIGCILQKNTSVTICTDQVTVEAPTEILCGSVNAQITYGTLTACSPSVPDILFTGSNDLQIIGSAGINTTALQSMSVFAQGSVYRLRGLVRFTSPVEVGQTFTIQFRVKSNASNPN